MYSTARARPAVIEAEDYRAAAREVALSAAIVAVSFGIQLCFVLILVGIAADDHRSASVDEVVLCRAGVSPREVPELANQSMCPGASA